MSRPALTLLGAALAFLAAGADAAIAKQTSDPDTYLRTLAAVSSQAAHSARASCLSRRSGNQVAYNQCLRAAFLAAGGPASAPPAPQLTASPPTRPQPGLDLEAPARPSEQRARPNMSITECPTPIGCAVVIGEYLTSELAHQALDEAESRHASASSPFDKYVQTRTVEDAQTAYRAVFTNGTREQAHALCFAIRSTGRQCEVARQARPRIVGSPNDTGTTGATPSDAMISSSVQIGAFSSIAIADREYAAVSARFGGYVADTEKVVQPVTSQNGSTYYRTSFTGMERERAVAFCNALKAAGRDCIVR